MANLISDADLKAWMGVAASTNDSQVAAANAGATARIAGWTGRTFQTVASSPRYYTPLTYGSCQIDDATTITEVATDDAGDGLWSTVWAATDWYAAPLGNIGPAGQVGWPYTNLVACGTRRFTQSTAYLNAGYAYQIPAPRPHVKVTAVWGWTAVPDDVKLAARLLGAELFKLHEAPFGASWNENGDVTIIRDNRPLRDLLRPYKKYGVVFA